MNKNNLHNYSLENGKKQKIRNGKPAVISIGRLSPKRLKILEDILKAD
jgi:hypothetical protein